MLKKLIENLFGPSYLEFSSQEAMYEFAAKRPDLVLSPTGGENPSHYYCSARWRLRAVSRH